MSDTTTTSIPEGASVGDSSDQIAALLRGEQTNDEPDKQEDNGTQTGEPDPSTQEGEGDESEQEGQEEQDPGYTEEDAAILAEALGIQPKDVTIGEDGKFRIAVKVDGEVSYATVEELKSGLQMGRNYTQKSQMLASERKEFEQVRAHVAQDLQSRLAVHDQLLTFQKNQLLSDFQGIDWNRLRAENPGEYAVRMRDFEVKQSNLENLGKALEENRARLDAEAQQEFMQHRTAWLQSQQQIEVQNNPSWSDPNTAAAEINALGTFATSTYGISPEDFAMLDNASYIEVLKDAKAYREGKAFADKQIQQGGQKFLKGGKASKPMSKLTQLTLSARKATGARRRELESAAVLELLTNGG
jgi:hypothetical protein